MWLPADDPKRAASRRSARIHAFDVEVHAFALLFNGSIGFSLGEFADFLLGWLGVDIARDDTPWPSKQTPRE